jgi:large subunit ribosomal protein L23
VNVYDILQRPILSEKSNQTREKSGQYTFLVSLKATKPQISRAIALAYGVQVDSVRTLVTRDRTRRRGMHVIAPSKTKKAVVKLKAGQKIPLFEDQ